MAVLEDFRLVSVSPELQPFPPSPMDEAWASFGTHDKMRFLPTRPLRSRPGPRQSQHGNRPNQGREPPLVWSVEFMKKVHVASNDTAPRVFPLVKRNSTFHCEIKPR